MSKIGVEEPLGSTGPFKFGKPTDDDTQTPFAYPDLWDVEKTTGPERLVLAPAHNQIDLILDLTHKMSGPFGILYVLLVSRLGHQEGRYQETAPIDREELAAFLQGFSEYFENDGRHHVWVRSLDDGAQAIYDNHNVIYAYGQLDAFTDIATKRGLSRGEVRFPVPHTHCYNPEYDTEEDRIFGEREWIHFPLQPQDEP